MNGSLLDEVVHILFLTKIPPFLDHPLEHLSLFCEVANIMASDTASLLDLCGNLCVLLLALVCSRVN